MNYKVVASTLIGMMVLFYTLGILISPAEKSVTTIESSITGSITGESLGTADANGDLVAFANHPIKTNSETVYADGVPSDDWNGSTYMVNYATGEVNVSAT